MKNRSIHIILVYLYCFILYSCTKEQEPIRENPPVDMEELQPNSEPFLSSDYPLLMFQLPNGNDTYEIDIYSSFDDLSEDTICSEIKSAIFVIHANNKNAKDISQDYFYPGPERIDNSTNQVVIPTTCDNHTNRPYGVGSPSAYMSKRDDDMINGRYINRKIDYLLGKDDVVTSGTLYSEDCEAVLLDRNKFHSVAAMYIYMSELLEDSHMHLKTLVAEVGHDAKFIFSSPAALSLFDKILER